MLIHIIVKDLKRMARDRKALIIMLLMPAVLTLIIGNTVGNMLTDTQSLAPAEVRIVSLGEKEADMKSLRAFLSNEFIQLEDPEEVLESISQFDPEQILMDEVLQNELVKEIIIAQKTDLATAEKQLQQGQATAIVILPENFTYDTLINYITPFRNPIEIQVLINPNHQLRGQIVESIIANYADYLSAGIIGKNTYLELAIEQSAGADAYNQLEQVINQLFEDKRAEINVVTKTIENKRPISGVQYYSVGMATMFILFTAGFGSSYFIGERQQYTYDRQLLANISHWEMLLGRILATAVFAFCQLLVLILFSMLILKVYWGNITLVILLAMTVALAIGGLTSLLSALNMFFNSEKATKIFDNMIVQIMALVGGSFFPVWALPEILNSLSKFTINGQALSGFLMIMQGYLLADLTGILVSLSVITLLISCGSAGLMWLSLRRI
ncbi:MAG: ABC transporter permease [Bacillota bacterium]|nr:ABC transporter permease [Bacillota bacterium]